MSTTRWHGRSLAFVAPRPTEKVPAVFSEQPREVAPLDEQTELHRRCWDRTAACGSIGQRRHLALSGEKIGLLMRQMGYSKPALLGNTVKGTGYAPLKAEIARRAVDYGCNISADDIGH